MASVSEPHYHWGKAAVRNLSYVPPNMADGNTSSFNFSQILLINSISG